MIVKLVDSITDIINCDLIVSPYRLLGGFNEVAYLFGINKPYNIIDRLLDKETQIGSCDIISSDGILIANTYVEYESNGHLKESRYGYTSTYLSIYKYVVNNNMKIIAIPYTEDELLLSILDKIFSNIKINIKFYKL